jgi:hypothetical protein
MAMDGKAGFTITVNGESNPYNIYSVFVMPNASVNITSQGELSLTSESVGIEKGTAGSWILKAPATKGAYVTTVRHDNKTMQLNVLVLTPLTDKKGEYLNGYRIGNYPTTPLRGNPIYNRPKGLFEVTDDMTELKLTPHFKVSQFLCKQAGGYPKYILVRERLLLKLEYLLEKVNDQGYEVDTFGFISGYRTPYYNASIKNVKYSRHVYGGAADIFIDADKNGSMDDLNRDGKVDEKDVTIFHSIVAREFDKPGYDKFRGGLGFYRKNGRHNGFIHVDVRGSKARW